MKIKFLSEDTLQDLRVNFETYKTNYYKKDDAWFDAYFKEEGRLIESKIEFEKPVFNDDENYMVSDFENVKVIYEALKHLTVSQATQERLWAGLSHVQMRDFSYYRLEKDLDKKNDNRIFSALFYKYNVKRSIFIHIIARLWWVGYMTYDENNKQNPYWLTEFFCSADFSARAVVFFSSNFTSNRAITKGILKALITLRDEGVAIKRDHFVEANKYLNISGGAMVLDLLEEDDVREMIEKRLRKVFSLEGVSI
ncbi:DUF6339 family protein [Lysinibacillus sp. SGAir0095]|uniref:DUF6339 family protein n=1 Tax=Lysinibacillus sp. SGAir0095 TaxID=2070463 RepID=UPI001F110ACA|nr:DUF6339 family protein [Lysinibacillus sp. SGAir0095]